MRFQDGLFTMMWPFLFVIIMVYVAGLTLFAPPKPVDEDPQWIAPKIEKNCVEIHGQRIGIRYRRGQVCEEDGIIFEHHLEGMPDSLYMKDVQPIVDSLLREREVLR